MFTLVWWSTLSSTSTASPAALYVDRPPGLEKPSNSDSSWQLETEKALRGFVAQVATGDRVLQNRLSSAIDDALGSGHCAHPPNFQWDMMSKPLNQEILNASGLEFSAAQLVFRHGARDIISSMQCFAPMNRSLQDCHLSSMVLFQKLGGREHAVPLVKTVINRHRHETRMVEEVRHMVSDCARGELLDEALPMTNAFGAALEAKYFKHLPRYPKLTDMWFYASDSQRTLGTLYYIIHQLRRDGVEEDGTVFPLYTRPHEADPWGRIVPCQRAMAFRETLSEMDPKMVQAWFPSLTKLWKEAAGTDFRASFRDCLTVAGCSGQEGLKLPQGLQPDSALYHMSVKVALALFQMTYLSDIRAQQLLVAPILFELEDSLLLQAAGDGPMVGFWSTHDGTMVSMLVALGAWDGSWPAYTESLVLELYHSKDDKAQAFFRWLRGGKPLTLPWCPTSSIGPRFLCNIKNFLPGEISLLRDAKVYARECAVPPSGNVEAMNTEKSLPTPLTGLIGFAFCVLACAGGYLMHDVVWRVRTMLRPTSSSDISQALLPVV